MKIEIQSPDFDLSDGLKAHIQRRLQFCLSRLESHITAISICLSNINGSKGNVDTLCRLQVSIINAEDIVIKETQTDLNYAIDRAMQRASRSAARCIDRQQKCRTKVGPIFDNQEVS